MNSDQSVLHLGRLLGNALRRFDARVLALMAEDVELPLKWANYARDGTITAAQVHMVRHLPREGSRLTDMAHSAGLSKQAMKSLLDQCEAMGLIVRQGADQQKDRRSKTIVYTQEGWLWKCAFERAVRAAELECEAELGSDILTVIKIGLEAYGNSHDRAIHV